MKTVLVTGAGRNIGKHLAERFAEHGYNVAVNARSEDSVASVAEGIRARGGSAMAVPADVRDRDQVRAAVSRVDEAFGGVDVLVNCAVIRVMMPIEEMDLAMWRLPLEVVLDGAFNCSQAVLPHMRERGWGRIVNIGGVSGQLGSKNRVGVVTAKSGIMGFSKALAREVATQGITVNTVSPGLIATERGEHTSVGDAAEVAAHYEKRQDDIPVGRMGELRDVSAACLYLVSDDAGYVTGQTLSVSGGLFM